MQKYFWLIILISVALGLIWPTPAVPLKPYLSYLLMLMMFFTCLKIDFGEMKYAYKSALKYIFALMMIFVVPSVIVLEMFGPIALLGSVIYMLVGHLALIPLQAIFSNRTHRVQRVQK